jgi:hypothetical protein
VVGLFDLGYLKRITYVETIDLSGPRLMLTMDDPSGYLRDTLRVMERDTLQVDFSDQWVMDKSDFSVAFTVMTCPNQGSIIEYELFETNIAKLKNTSKQGASFRNKPVDFMLKQLAPGLKYDIEPLPAITALLPPGARPSKTIRQAAYEHGAAAFIARGTFTYKTFDKLLKQPVDSIYYYKIADKLKQITSYEKPNSTALFKSHVVRNYIGWSMTEGILKSNSGAGLTPEFTEVDNQSALDNLSKIPYPAIDFDTMGNGALRPGIKLKLVWGTDAVDMPIDESLPEEVLVGTVAHHYSAQSYRCRVVGVLI